MRFICGPDSVVTGTGPGVTPVVLYGGTVPPGGESAGAAAAVAIRKKGLEPAPAAWDLLSLALAVVTADSAVRRSTSADGWTRELDLEVAVSDTSAWTRSTPGLESALAFLTTDRWSLTFIDGAEHPDAPKKPKESPADGVALLSGGLDSLIGAIDLHASGSAVLAVSHIVRGDQANQKEFGRRTGVVDQLLVNHNVSVPWEAKESSQRSRSLVFLAFAVLAATATEKSSAGEVVPVYICENGFIAINPPLTAARVGSLSTRTAHPHFLGELQRVLDALGLRVTLENPYAEQTKGEMLAGCKDQGLLVELAVQSTSCGKSLRHKYTQCGRCVPCSVRRAAFLAAGWSDTTKYLVPDLSTLAGDELDDVRSIAMARILVEKQGLDRWIGPSLSSPHISNRAALRSMIGRGLDELGALLARYGVA